MAVSPVGYIELRDPGPVQAISSARISRCSLPQHRSSYFPSDECSAERDSSLVERRGRRASVGSSRRSVRRNAAWALEAERERERARHSGHPLWRE